MVHTSLQVGLWGTVVGDMIGLPYETLSHDKIPDLPHDLLDIVAPPFQRQHLAAPRGAYSDDGSQALCLAASLEACGGFNVDDFGARLLRWMDDGYMASSGTTFGAGGTTRRAMANLRAGIPASRSGIFADDALGNAPIMRGIALPLWCDGTSPSTDAMAQCRVTHVHPRAQVVAAVHATWVRFAADDPECDPMVAAEIAIGDVRSEFCYDDPLDIIARELELIIATLAGHNGPPDGGFHILDTFHSAVACQRESSYGDVLRAAIRLGNDVDTTCAVAGGVAALRFGLDGIPRHWRQAVWDLAPLEARALLGAP